MTTLTTTICGTTRACVSCRAPLTSTTRHYCTDCRPPLLAIVPAQDEMHNTTHCARAPACRCAKPATYRDDLDDLRCLCGHPARTHERAAA